MIIHISLTIAGVFHLREIGSMITDNQGFYMQNYAYEFLRAKQQLLLYRSRQVEGSFHERHGI